MVHQAVGGALLVGGATLAGIFATIGLAARPDVLTHWDLRKLIDEHNAVVRGSTLRVVPLLAPTSLGLMASGEF
jgi:hypothetical protein